CTKACGLLACLVLAAGCGSMPTTGFFAPIFRASFGGSLPAKAKKSATGAAKPGAATGSVEIVERSLRERGLRFGTDGTPESLYAYVRYSHELVPAAQARPGDIVFFDLGDHGCGEHLGLVEAVEGEGRITFRE